MAFKIGTEVRKVWWPVEIQVPTDGGRAEVQKIDAQFEVIDQDESDRVVSGQAESSDLLARVVVGLRQRKTNPKDEDQPIQGEDGTPMAFEEAKALMLKVQYIRTAFFAAYGRCANGQGRVKN